MPIRRTPVRTTRAARRIVLLLAVVLVGRGIAMGRSTQPRVIAQTEPIVERVASGTDYTLREVEFVDPLHGFATGGNGNQNQFVVVVRTRDGGQTWQDITPPDTKTFNAQSFVDPNHGWVVGVNGQLYRTVDGGDSWQGLDPGPGAGKRLLRVEFHDAHLGWIAVAGERWILKTTDGGDHWRQVEVNFKDGITDLQFIDANVGYGTGTDGVLLTTTDGGETWSNIGFGNPAKMVSVWFADRQHGWVAASEIRATSDGGAAWRSQGKPPKSINDLVFLDAREGWAAGDEGVLMHTTDGGDTWQRVGEGVTRDALLGVGIARPGVVYAVGTHGAIVRFTDPGRLASPTPTASATRTATTTPTPAPTATPSGPWLSLGRDARVPFYVNARGGTTVQVTYGNQPGGGTLTGAVTGAAVFDDGTDALSAPATISGGAGRMSVVLRAGPTGAVGDSFTLSLELGGAQGSAVGRLGAFVELPLLRKVK
ncbi:MAG: YCF48-related protein [Ardenticatenales bacterium]